MTKEETPCEIRNCNKKGDVYKRQFYGILNLLMVGSVISGSAMLS